MRGKIFRPTKFSSLGEYFVTFVRQPHSFLYLLFYLLGTIVDPMKEGFLIRDLLKRSLTKYKKGTETSIKPEEDQGIEDHDKFINFGQ